MILDIFEKYLLMLSKSANLVISLSQNVEHLYRGSSSLLIIKFYVKQSARKHIKLTFEQILNVLTSCLSILKFYV